jgi:spore germination protein YaaH
MKRITNDSKVDLSITPNKPQEKQTIAPKPITSWSSLFEPKVEKVEMLTETKKQKKQKNQKKQTEPKNKETVNPETEVELKQELKKPTSEKQSTGILSNLLLNFN